MSLRKNFQKSTFSPTLEINERVKELRHIGHEVYHFGFGESPFPVHPFIKEALIRHADKNSYLPTAGLSELRTLALEYFSGRLGFDKQAFVAMIGPGSKDLIFAFQACLEGDLLVPVPSWVSYGPQAGFLNDRVIRVWPTENPLKISAADLQKTIRESREAGFHPKKLILNTPNNPTGVSFHPAESEALAKVCREEKIYILSDEIYGLVSPKGTHQSIAKFAPERTIVTTGLSKHLSLGGYRLGTAFIPSALPELFQAFISFASETWSCASTPIQYAGLEALSGKKEIEAYIADCAAIHGLVGRFVRDRIRLIGVDYPALEGAFYLFPNFGKFRDLLDEKGIKTSVDLAKALLEDQNFASLPGSAFMDGPENLTLRLAFCDYDGAGAYEAYSKRPNLNDADFVERYCPRVARGLEGLSAFFKGL